MTSTRPGFDPDLRALLDGMPLMAEITAEALPQIRPFASAPIEPLLDGRAVERREVTIPGPDGASIPLSILGPVRKAVAAPCVYWIHGGGMVMGDRYSQIDIPLEWLDELGAVVVSVDYRLAPEARGATLVDDCYAGLAWVTGHADELGIDPARVVVAGARPAGPAPGGSPGCWAASNRAGRDLPRSAAGGRRPCSPRGVRATRCPE